jgi:hypothetical protein
MAAEAALLRYVAMAHSREVAEAVITQLGIDESPERLLGRISVESSDDTLTLSLRVSDVDAASALRVATALGDEVRQRVEDEVITPDTVATDRAIRRIQRDLGRLRERYNRLRSRNKTSTLERQEVISLAGDISSLEQARQQLSPSSSALARNRLEWFERPSSSGQEESDERQPQAKAEPSEAATPGPTAAVEAVTTTRSDLVPGVDLTTDEVEPGVFRVVSDGVRDLRRPVEDAEPDAMSEAGPLDRSLHAAPDGSIWVFGREGAFRLGQTDVVDIDWLAAPVIDDSPDGTMWASWRLMSSRAGGERILRLGRLQDGAWQGQEVARDGSLPLEWKALA